MKMDNILIANIFTLIAQAFNFYASTRKEKNQILFYQSFFWALISVSTWMLKGYSAIVTNVIGIIRNTLSIKGINNRYLSYLLIILCIVFGYIFNSNGFFGYLPVIANVAQSIVVLSSKARTRHVQIVNCLSMVCWAFFNFHIKSYVGSVFNIITAVSYILTIFSADKKDNG